MEINYFIIDTFAWIEYLKGTESGLKLLELVKTQKNEFFTPLVLLAELKDYCLFSGMDFDEAHKIIRENSRILELNEDDAIEAGKIHFLTKKQVKNFGYIDSFIVAAYHRLKQVNKKTKIITGDQHFRKFDFVEFIGKK